VNSRQKEHQAPRDNVIFELGLLTGALGRERTLMATPAGIDLKIPSDLAGVVPVKYPRPVARKNFAQLLARAASDIHTRVERLGSR
jgi:predicted nucleotide-binding protein